MKKNSYKKPNKVRTNTTITVANLKKAQQHKEFHMSLDDAYEIVAGYKEVTAKDPKIAKLIFARAMRMVEKDDAEFAKNLKTLAQSEQRTNLKNMVFLADAYDIVSGDKTVDSETYSRALKLLQDKDPAFVKYVKEYKKYCQELESAVQSARLETEKTAENVESLVNLFNDESVREEVFADSQVEELSKTTSVEDENGNELSADEVNEVVYNVAQDDTLVVLTRDYDFANASDDEQRSRVVDEMKKSVKRTFLTMRFSALKEKISDKIKALKEGNSHFFENKIAKLRDAFNFKKKVKVSVQDLRTEYQKSGTRLSSFIPKLMQKGHKKAAALINKFKTKSHQVLLRVVPAVILTSSVMSSCNTSQGRPDSTQEQPRVEVKADTTKQQATQVTELKITETQKASVIVTPQEWNDSTKISEARWNQLNSDWGYQTNYAKITDDMLEKSGFETRDQFLNAYRALRSFYPEVIEDDGVLEDRSTASEKFSKYFNNDDCVQATDFTDEDFEILKLAPSLVGTWNKYSTGETKDGQPCDPGTVHHKRVVTKTKTTSVKPSEVTPTPQGEELSDDETFNEVPGSSVTISDNDDEATFTNVGGSHTVITEQSDSVSTTVTVHKGNSYVNSVQVDSIPATDLNIKAPNVRDVLVESRDVPISTNLSQTSENGFAEVKGTSTTVTEGFVEVKGSSVTVNEGFNEVSGTSVTVTEEVTENKGTSSAQVDEYGFVIETGTTTTVSSDVATEQGETTIVGDSDELPLGTPSPDNTPERGGYENSGLSEKQYKRMQNFFRDRFGDNAFEDFMERITDDMRAKGGVFEGLSRAEALFSVQQMIAWSNDRHGKFADEIRDVTAYLNGCNETLTIATEIKDIIDDVNQNGTIDGVIGRGNKRVKFYQLNDCGEAGTYGVVRGQGSVKPTNPTGPKFPRLYMQFHPVSQEPISEPTFNEVSGSYKLIYTPVEQEDPTVQIYKGNTQNDGRLQREVSAESVTTSTNTTDVKDVLVEHRGDQPVANNKKDEKKAKKAERQARRDREKARKEEQKREEQKRLEGIKRLQELRDSWGIK